MRLAPRLAVSLPLSGLFVAAHAMGADLAAAVAAAGAAGAVLSPSQRMAGVCLAAGATAAALLAAALTFGTAALLAALPVLGHLGFAWHFGRTLAPGQEALITRYTRADLGEPGPRLAAYTRALTLFWTLAFLGFALDPDGKVRELRMEPISPLTDFSFDFQDLRLAPVKAK